MARVIGVDIPNDKRMEISLTYIYGVGRHTALKVCKDLGMDPGMKPRDLNEEQLTSQGADGVWKAMQRHSWQDQSSLVRDLRLTTSNLFHVLRKRSRMVGREDPRRGVQVADLALKSHAHLRDACQVGTTVALQLPNRFTKVACMMLRK